MYITKTAAGRGYTVAYPEFDEAGCATVNRFYETFRDSAAGYFESLTAEDRRLICRCTFSVEETDCGFTVNLRLTLRRCGRRCGETALTHKWRRWDGRDTLMVK